MLSKWFSEDSRRFAAYGEYFEGPPSDVSLLGLLNINSENLKPFTKVLLAPGQQSQWLQASISELSRGINAFFQFQDIFDIKLDIEIITDIVNRHYTYYESLVCLRESVSSWLDRNVLAGLTLLRPFLELSVFHVYWYLRGEHENYKAYYNWLKNGKGKPGFQTALDYIFNNLTAGSAVDEKRFQELRITIQNAYKALCAYSHTPQMNESITAKSGNPGDLALESFYYYLAFTNLLLRQVIYLYILAYPMSLFPVEKYIKFAFSGPVGLFFDNINYAILETFIGSETTDVLRQSLSSNPEVLSLRNWFDSLPSLTTNEIEGDWENIKKEIPNLDKDVYRLEENNVKYMHARLALMKSVNRAFGWAQNYVTDETKDDEISEEVIEKCRKRMRAWHRNP